jgi:hypothetical protein
MRRLAAAVLLAAVAGSGAARAAWEAAAAAGADPLEKAVKVDWQEAKLTKALADLAVQGGVSFIVDPALPADVRDSTVTYSDSDVTLSRALGQALRQAGLRYAMRGGTIFVSTPRRLAERIVYGRTEALPEAEPMTRSEAHDILAPEMGDDHLIGPGQIHRVPWRKPEEPSVNPATGLTDFPAPPIWIDSPDADSPRFRYTTRPSFLKAEHADEADEESRSANEDLGRLIEIIKRHPDWDRDGIAAVLRTVDEGEDDGGAEGEPGPPAEEPPQD